MDNTQQPQQIDFTELLFDFDRRKREGVIATERVEKNKIKITVFQRHPFEVDKTIGEVSGLFSESHLEDLAYDQDIKIANLNKQRNEMLRQIDAQIELAQKIKTEIYDSILKEIETLESEFEKQQASK
jgi:hypothetical protein